MTDANSLYSALVSQNKPIDNSDYISEGDIAVRIEEDGTGTHSGTVIKIEEELYVLSFDNNSINNPDVSDILAACNEQGQTRSELLNCSRIELQISPVDVREKGENYWTVFKSPENNQMSQLLGKSFIA